MKIMQFSLSISRWSLRAIGVGQALYEKYCRGNFIPLAVIWSGIRSWYDRGRSSQDDFACSRFALLLLADSPDTIAFTLSPMVIMMIAIRYWTNSTTHRAGAHILCSGSSRTSPALRMRRSVLDGGGFWDAMLNDGKSLAA